MSKELEFFWKKRRVETVRGVSECILVLYIAVQSGAAYHSLGFEDDDLGSSPGWWAATVATYCPSRPGDLPKFLS